jgi:hypothetical protein
MDPEQQLAAREYVRRVMHDMFGTLRSAASQMKAEGLTDDEEKAFKQILRNVGYVISVELSKLSGPEEASRMLDPFSRPTKLNGNDDSTL